MAVEIVAHERLYLRESFALLYSVHIIVVCLYHIYLFQELFPCQLDGVVVHLHLPGKELFEPRVLLDAVVNEAYRLFPFDLHRGFPFLPVVEPRLRPPSHSGTVGIDGDDSRYVEALDVDVQLRQRVDDTAVCYCFVMKFFFTSPPAVER